MLNFLGGCSGKRHNIRAENELEGEKMREHMPSRSADHNSDMANASFAQNLLRLPAFVRNRILPMVGSSPKQQFVTSKSAKTAGLPVHTSLASLGCKTLRGQAHRIFYAGNSFEIRVSSFNAGPLVSRWQRHAANLDAVRNEPIIIAIASDEDGVCNDMSEGDARPKLDASETSLTYKNKALLYQNRRHVLAAPLVEGGFSIQTQNLKEWRQLFHADFLPALSITYTYPTDQRFTHVSAMFDSVAAYKHGDTRKTAEKCLEGHRKILIADDGIWSLPCGELQFQYKVEACESSTNQRQDFWDYVHPMSGVDTDVQVNFQRTRHMPFTEEEINIEATPPRRIHDTHPSASFIEHGSQTLDAEDGVL
ncbi:hypothetical protein AC578_6507 [Pseudocercospora eumusae]|uniref:Uncharacterized protein n=1 Tax=Pseudocercospora eumusae TaxID=321146 RepID=A0A139HHZ7_9PEZI|nr:hypothetical protein AC578_6507 [Pseudocercospora eumusae]